MRNKDQDHTDHGLEQAGGSGQGIFPSAEPDPVHIGIDYIDGLAVDVVLHVDDLVEFRAQ